MRDDTKKLPDPNTKRSTDNAWHGAINRFHDGRRGDDRSAWMYEAKDLATEVPRLVVLLEKERTGALPKIHRQCSISPTEPVQDNHLTCCLGVECRACPHLLALDGAEMEPTERDRAKAWTCATHVIRSGGDVAREGFILTTDDRMFWSNVYASLAADDDGGGA